ncbi:Bulb-type lectin domain containing protein [uncultured Caudovirales phage]|uniref:Bulb-type lectin domain containing protein n=1 Tax=uncultured Caudovirales phage TaxID=2100421 RepID=A0A6J5REC2_9CAUD|nr:Bulb-type lectin domain containing protein [uncultured Caudovirales phage]
MTQGIKVQNDNGQLIISDATSTFYYYGPAELAQVIGSGVDSGVTIRTHNSYTSAPIIPFIRPHSGDLVAITRIYRGYANYWFIETAQAGLDASAPEVIIFTTADAENWNSRFSRGDRTKGLRVKRADGTTAFDSSVGQPLTVRSVYDVMPPYDPTSGGQDLAAVNTAQYNVDPSISQPMYGYYSMALCEREYTVSQYSRDCTGIGAYGACIGFVDTVSRTDLYWTFYHAAMGLRGSVLHCGWVEYANGHQWSSSSSSGFAVFIPIIGLGGGSYSGGAAPFVNQTINWTAAKVLIADKAFFPGTNYSYTPPIPNAPRNLLAQTQILADGRNVLVADWQNSLNYPFAISYNVYVKKSGSATFAYIGNTTRTTANGPAGYYDFPAGTTLQQNETLNTWVPLYNQARTAYLVAQNDGNVVVYASNYAVIANFSLQGAAGFQATRLVMQSDGNFVVYRNSDNYPVYNTGSYPGYMNYALYLANDFSLSLWAQNATTYAWSFRMFLHDPSYGEAGIPALPVSYWDVKITSVNANGVEGGSIEAQSTSVAIVPPPDYTGGGD